MNEEHGSSWMVGHLLRRCTRRHNALWSQSVESRLTSVQYLVLRAISLESDLSAEGIREALSIDRSTAFDVVRRLESTGWLRRVADLSGGRAVPVLTEPAEVAVEAILPLVMALQDELLTSVPPDVKEQFRDALRAFAPPIDESAAMLAGVMDAPGHLMRRAQRWHSEVWAATVGSGVTGPQYAVLHFLQLSTGVSQRQLGDAVALDRSSASDVIRRLRSKGLVSVERHPGDRRERIVRLTEDGRSACAELLPAVLQAQRETLAPVPAEVRDLLVRGLGFIAFDGEPPSPAELLAGVTQEQKSVMQK